MMAILRSLAGCNSSVQIEPATTGNREMPKLSNTCAVADGNVLIIHVAIQTTGSG